LAPRASHPSSCHLRIPSAVCPEYGIGYGGAARNVVTMSQIFHRTTNVYSRLSILAVPAFAGFLGWVVWTLHWSGYSTNQSVFV